MNISFCVQALSKHRWKRIMCYVVIGLSMVLLFSRKSRIDLETIAVSSDEEYIACFETGNGRVIRCFRSDGSLLFNFDIPADISAGGNCTLWFENDLLCVLFYRTDVIVYFSTDGTILETSDSQYSVPPQEFPSFVKHGNEYVFEGDRVDVIYNKRGLLEYWFFNAERYLAIKAKNGATRTIYAWTAKDGVIKKPPDHIQRRISKNSIAT